MRDSMPSKPTILIVDDDSNVLVTLGGVLSDTYTVVGIENPASVEDAILACQPAAIVLDYLMPRRNGVDVCKAIRANPTWDGIPVIFLSALDDREGKEAYYAAGACDFLAKPFDLFELKAKLDVWISLSERNAELTRRNRELEQIARTDHLTGATSHRHGMLILERAVAAHERYGTPCALLMLDIDNFKDINDRFGHVVGDRVLTAMAGRIRQSLRETDDVIRYGGDEFLLVLPHTGEAAAIQAGEKIRALIRGTPLILEPRSSVHVSLGVASLTSDMPDALAWITSADIAMLQAKATGKDRVCCYRKDQVLPTRHESERQVFALSAEEMPLGYDRHMPDMLIADASVGDREHLAALLGAWGYSVSEARGGVDALAALERISGDCLVFLGWSFPDIGAVELIQSMRAVHPDRTVHVIALVGVGEDDVPAQAFDSGADDCLRRDCSPDELQGRLRLAARVMRQESSLRLSERRYRHLVENAGSVILRLDTAGNILFCNDYALNLFGYERNELIGRNVIGSIVPPVDSAGLDLRDMMDTLCRDPNRFSENENENMKKDGSRIRIAWTNRPLFENGVLREVLCIGNDVTRRHNAEKALIRSERMAALGILAGGIAHEFNNINAVIMGYANLIQEHTPLPDEIGEYATVIHSAIQRSSHLTRRLLDFASQKAGNMKVHLLNEIALSTLELLREELASRGVTLSFAAHADGYASFDSGEISQIILNLVINADHAMIDSAVKHLNVEIGVDDGFAWCRVSDTGCGIPADAVDKIFLPFFSTKGEYCRDPRSSMSQIKGTGLGLSVSDMIATQNGGSLTLESTSPQGTSFLLRLPACARPKARPSTGHPKRRSATLSGKCVLAVDDESDLLALMSVWCRAHGAVATVCQNAAAALEHTRAHAPDLAFVDLQMPGMNGEELIRRLRADHPDMPIIAMSGRLDDARRDELSHLGCTDTLDKPFDEPAMFAAACKALVPAKRA